MNKDLKSKAFSGIKWNGASSLINVITQFIGTAILARILLPTEFGLFGIAMIVVNFAQVFSNFGLFEAILHEKDLENRKTMTFLWLSLLIGAFLTILCVFSAPLFAWFFEEPELTKIIMVLSLIFLFSPYGGIFVALLRRELLFKHVAIVESASIVFGKTVSVLFAFLGFGVFSIVFGNIATVLIRAVSATYFSKKMFRFEMVFDVATYKKYLSFGLYRMGSKITHYFSTNVERILIGKLLGTESLGYYNLTSSLVVQPIQQLHPMIHKVTIPILCKCRDTVDQLKAVFFRTNKYYFLIVFPILFGISAVAEPFVRIVYGEKWVQIIPLIQILAIGEVFHSVWYSTTILQIPTGKMDVGFIWGIIQMGIKIVFVSAAAYFGLVPLAFAISFTHIIFMVLSYSLMFEKMVGSALKEFFYDNFFIPIIYSSFMFLSVIFLINLVNLGSINELIVGTILGIAVYSSIIFLREKIFYKEVFSMFKRI
jgi:O-antigen/teichoic acid export membrane protein